MPTCLFKQIGVDVEAIQIQWTLLNVITDIVINCLILSDPG